MKKNNHNSICSANKSKEQWKKIIISILKIKNYQNNLDGHSWNFNNKVKRYVSCNPYYHISKEVEKKIVNTNNYLKNLIEKKQPVDMKKFFYGKDKETTIDHMIPTAVIVNELLKLIGKNNIEKKVKRILNKCGNVSIILRKENKHLNSFGLTRKMPNDWNFNKSYIERYKTAGIKLSKAIVYRTKEICI